MIVLPERRILTEWTQDEQAQVSCAPSSSKNNILTVTCRNGLQPYLAFVGQAWDAALDTNLTWRVLRNGYTLVQLKDSKVQIAPPEQSIQEITPWLRLGQQDIIRFEADINATPVAAGNVTARLRIYYTPLDQIEQGFNLPAFAVGRY